MRRQQIRLKTTRQGVMNSTLEFFEFYSGKFWPISHWLVRTSRGRGAGMGFGTLRTMSVKHDMINERSA